MSDCGENSGKQEDSRECEGCEGVGSAGDGMKIPKDFGCGEIGRSEELDLCDLMFGRKLLHGPNVSACLSGGLESLGAPIEAMFPSEGGAREEKRDSAGKVVWMEISGGLRDGDIYPFEELPEVFHLRWSLNVKKEGVVHCSQNYVASGKVRKDPVRGDVHLYAASSAVMRWK